MKLVMNEKLKHRLVGLSVILSLGAIFLPAMMKKSSQRLEGNLSINVQLPPKPAAPNVAVIDKEQMFKTIKVAKVHITPPASSTPSIASLDKKGVESTGLHVAKVDATAASVEKSIELALNEAVKQEAKKEIKAAAHKPVKLAKAVVSKSIIAKAPRNIPIKRELYAVQLASFAKLSNAQALVGKLQHKGYKANYIRAAGKNGVIYKVYVGHSPIKNNVVKLKTQLASAMQLNGFIVNAGVS